MAQDAEKTIDQLNDEADIAADYLEGLLDIVDYEGVLGDTASSDLV